MASRNAPATLALPVGSSEAASTDTAGVATFISKVWKIVEKPEFNHLISWSDSGKTFIVHEYSRFAKDVLPLYFKHSNFNSFVRQLNLYGFRKVAKPDHGSLAKAQVNEPVEFWHTNFRRGHPELLHFVQRRSVVSRVVSEEKSPQISKVMSDIHHMKGRQESIAGMIETMKQDNQHLRRELSLMKDKHIRQQRVLNKIIQFLVHMVYKGKLPGSRRRSSRLMLMDAETQPPPAKRMRNLSDGSSSSYNVQSPPVHGVPSISVQSPLFQSTSPLPTHPMMQSPPTSPELATELGTGLPLSGADSQFSLGSVPISPPPSSAPVPVPVTSSSAGPTLQPPELLPESETSALQLPGDFMTQFHLTPPPVSLISAVPPERLPLSEHLDQQQQGLEAFPDLFSGQLSVDPSVISEFISTESLPVPEYDIVDTARLLESLTNDRSGNVAHESTLHNNALVPFSSAQLLSGDGSETDSSLQELLEGLPSSSQADM